MHIITLLALADPTRLQIVGAMRHGECAVNDIVERFDIHQSGISRHLRILREAGIVRVRPQGQQRFYSLRPEPFAEIEAWIDGYRSLWEARLDRFGAVLERKKKSHLERARVEKSRIEKVTKEKS
jgi:DNA-binding transcriptional ArsR family regulator